MKYQLIIKIPFEAIDDIEARKKAEPMLVTDPVNKLQEVYEVPVEPKLQEIFINKPPRGIALNLTPEG
jgi:hypothetical protein